MSAGQRGRWFLYQLDPASQSTHNVSFSARLHGPVDIAKFEQAFQRLLDAHPMLRTSFEWRDGEPWQRTAPHATTKVLAKDISGLTDAQAIELIRADSALAFDLRSAPLMRIVLYRGSPVEGFVLFSFDHLIGDGWSYWRFMHQFGEVLASIDIEPQRTLPLLDDEEEAGYADYVEWQASWLKSEEGREQLEYWSGVVRPEPAPRHFPRTQAGATSGGPYLSHHFSFRKEAFQRLASFCSDRSISPFALLLSVFQVMLARHFGAEDIVIGSMMPARRRRWRRTFGDFANPVVLRTQVRMEASFGSILDDARRTARRAMLHQDLPFSVLVEQVGGGRISTRHPLFQIAYVFQRARDAGSVSTLWGDDPEGRAADWGGLQLTSCPVYRSGGNAGVDLILEALELDDHLRCSFNYDSSIFDESTMARLVERFDCLLWSALDHPSEPVGRLAMLGESERKAILLDFNATSTTPSADLIHTLFEAQVFRTPDAPALDYEGVALSYAELNRRANRLAHALIAGGVTPDTRVGLCMERSLGLVVSLLGILKAGGAYVPLDPAYPRERLRYMVEDSAPAMMLVQAGLEAIVEAPHLLVLDEAGDWPQARLFSDDNPQLAALRPDHLAYVIYTSGSTGQPKGVMNQHDGVVNRLQWAQSVYRLDGSDTLLQKTPYSFDVSVWEFFLPLLAGARLVMARPGGHQQPDYLHEVIERESVTMVHFVPSMLSLFLEAQASAALPSLRRVLCSGEALPPSLQQQFLRRYPQIELHNLYGPTEAAVHVTSWQCESACAQDVVPIGRPIANARMYVLDAHGEPAPIGVAGELVIGGVGVARGYLNRPELTRERFVDDPFSHSGGRLYRSGDLARWRADGVLEYLGRNDHQVKVRGFRIELGEIEAALLACEDIREAVVVAREDEPGDRRLVAYVVGDEACTKAAVLREQLSQRLADYMLPSAYVSLESMPLNSNGKLERSAFPRPGGESILQHVYEPPQGDVEIKLAALWQDLLGIERIGRRDHFFEMGGYSMLVVRLGFAIKKHFDVDAEISQLLQAPVMQDMAARISQQLQCMDRSETSTKTVVLDL
jgi:amino acid adenylation domain-containing protein